MQELHGSSTYLSMTSLDLTFGLGRANVVDRIEIHWPSGRTQVLREVEVDQVLRIDEPPQ